MEGNKWLKDTLSMQRKGFKWKSLKNENGLRYQIMELKRPKELESKIVDRNEPIVFKSGLVCGSNQARVVLND